MLLGSMKGGKLKTHLKTHLGSDTVSLHPWRRG